MMDMLAEITTFTERRQAILAKGLGLADLEEYNVLTLKIATAVPVLLRVINDVIVLRDELANQPDGPAAPVARAFAHEIDRALKGQRNV